MQDKYAVPKLMEVLSDVNENAMVRHEAGEALGGICDEAAIPVLQKFQNDSTPEVAETCQLALQRINWVQKNQTKPEKFNPYSSVDPTPSDFDEKNLEKLTENLIDESLPLFRRY